MITECNEYSQFESWTEKKKKKYIQGITREINEIWIETVD